MNIKGVIFDGNSKQSNPLKKNNKSSVPSFSGHVLTKDVYGNNVYKFFLPNAPKDTKVVITRLEQDGNGDFKGLTSYKDGKLIVKTVEKDLTGDIPSYTLFADDWNLSPSTMIGYKFKLPDGRYYFDNTAAAFVTDAKNDETKYTMATPLWSANPTRPRVMQHLMPDSYNPDKKTAKRNHFNVFGGKIQNINEMVDELSKQGFTAILSTPVFGQDNTSSHGYWTNNAYQITDNLGNIDDFKKLIVNLYKHDMKWTADGAFVNEGLQGIHIKDIVNWGAQSPYVDMFETKDLENLPVRFGVISKNEEVAKHTHFKLVNAPYKIIFEKANDGTYREKEIKSSKVDPTKPTYVQIFDDRLASKAQMNDSENVFSVYDKKDTGDNFEIASYRDAVQPYYHRVSLKEVKTNHDRYKEAKKADKNIEFKNILSKWSNFEFVESNKDGGIALWVGNSDIAKKQFLIPEKTLPEDLSLEKRMQKLAAQYQVQDDIVQIGKFWTSEVARTLTEYTAKAISDKIRSEENKISYQDALMSLINEGKLPEGAEKILEKIDGISALDNILTKDPWDGGRNYQLKNVKMPVSVTDGIMSYPFDAIEFSPDLVSIFAYPYIKNLAVTDDTVGKSRYEMYKMGDDYYNLIPAKYRDLYKKMDKVIANDMTNQAINILQKLEAKTHKTFFDEKGDLTETGKEIYSLIAADISKFLVVSALAPEINPFYSNKENFTYDINDLKQISLNSLNLQYETAPEEVAKRLIEKLQKGVKNISDEKIGIFVQHLSDRVKYIDSDSINVAKLILETTEAGLDWRIDAAKDVSSIDSVEDGVFDNEENENFIMTFWKKFNKGVREYNPNSYTVGELTDKSHLSTDSKFTRNSYFSTITDYEFLYNLLPSYFGYNAENAHNSNLTNTLYDTMKQFLSAGTPDNVNFIHRFSGNHDKPRILHLFSMNMPEFAKNKGQEMANVLNSGFSNSNTFKNLDEKWKQSIYDAVRTLQGGHKTINGASVEFDSENFGVRPFDFNIDSVIDEAMAQNKEFAAFVNAKDKDNNYINAPVINKLKAETLESMLKTGLERYKALWFALNALPGTPTNYAGDELGMTGWETASKNEKQENRNALRHDRLADANYKFIKDYKDEIDKITNIRKKDGASALSNGALIPITAPAQNSAAFYRYNDKTDAICIVHNKGFGANNPEKINVKRIDLGGLPYGLKKGTIYVDATNTSSKYKVTNEYEIKKVDDNDTNKVLEEINLGSQGLILLRESSFDGKKFSFKGRLENPNIKLANTKYNFSYMNK